MGSKSVIIQKTFRYRLEPTGEQLQIFARFAGCCRFVFNLALAARKLAYKRGNPGVSPF